MKEQTMVSHVTPARLSSLFKPRSVALVGASDKSMFSQLAFGNLMQFGFGKHTHIVNPRSSTVHGHASVPSIGDIDEPVDVAFLMVPQGLTLDAMSEAAAAGVRNAVILSSGYAETGPAGRLAEEELVAHAEKLGMVILGPNHLGFVNFVDRVPVAAIPSLPNTVGSIALLSQSGASSMAMLDFATASGNELSYMVTLGNESMITAGHALEFFVQDESTRAIAIFMETIREPEVFRRAAIAALEAGKAVVALKAGSSQLAARTAAAHTGALVGDDSTVDAIFRELGVIRVTSIEDMMVTAGLAAQTGPVGSGGVGIVSVSGGACDIIADRAEVEGVELPVLAESTVARIADILPAYGTVQNPLDATGQSVIDRAIFTNGIIALSEDPSVAVVGVVTSVPWEGAGPWYGQSVIDAIGLGIAGAATPTIFINQVMQPVTAYTRRILEEAAVPNIVNGLGNAVTALGGVLRWSERRLAWLSEDHPVGAVTTITDLPAEPRGSWSEHSSRTLLERAGVPVVPAVLALDEETAVSAAAGFGGPVALKIVSPDIAHKSDIGGVRLGVSGDEAVRAAYNSVRSAGESVVGAAIEGVLVSPMRSGGIELLVGAVRDAQWGPMLAIALGGVFVEVLGDAALTSVPVSPARVKKLLGSLKAAPLLHGARGGTPVDIDALAEVIARIGDVVAGLGDDLESLEVNPLRVNGSEIEALDALVTWRVAQPANVS
jgi:acyl-CoA synthetase (NDP forming)